MVGAKSQVVPEIDLFRNFQKHSKALRVSQQVVVKNSGDSVASPRKQFMSTNVSMRGSNKQSPVDHSATERSAF